MLTPAGTSARISSTAAERNLVIDPGECLAYIEALPLTVEVAMIVGLEFGVGAKLAGEQSAGQGNTRQDPDLLRLAWAKNSSAGRWRKQLKMICTIADWGTPWPLSASSTRSTLTP